MDAHRVSESEADLPTLIDLAVAGEPVVITRDGQPVAELRAVERRIEASDALKRLGELRDALGPVGMTSVELLNAVYEEDLCD